jgi:hypothetical protein
MNRFALLTALVALSCAAQPVRNTVERANDRKDLRQDRRQTADDKQDAARADAWLREYDAARASGDVGRIAAAEAAFTQYIASELAESARELGQAKQEVREDNREVRGDRRELGRDVGRPVRAADDARDLRRDQVNRADDRGDVRKEAAARLRLQAIQAELAGLNGKLDPGSLAAKRARYAEVTALAKNELRRDVQEHSEDKRELREDRRETREDRRRR